MTFKSFSKTFIYLFILREREKGRGRQRERENSKEVPLSTEPDAGLNPTNHKITTRAKIKSLMLKQLSHPGTPRNSFFF